MALDNHYPKMPAQGVAGKKHGETPIATPPPKPHEHSTPAEGHTAMALYFKKLAGEWVVYGPADEIQLGEVTVQKRNGRTKTATITRIGKDVRIGSDRVRLGHLDNDDTKTYREKREAKAERLRDWAEKRQTEAVAVLNSQPELRSDWAFITQPGRIPARDRMNAADERAFRSMDKAEEMAERADNIEAAAAGAIYSDDADAIERLEAKIADLEAQRARIKAYNASCRKGQPDLSVLNARERADLNSTARCASYMLGKNGEFPSYHLQNLGGNITRSRQRLERLKREKELLS